MASLRSRILPSIEEDDAIRTTDLRHCTYDSTSPDGVTPAFSSGAPIGGSISTVVSVFTSVGTASSHHAWFTNRLDLARPIDSIPRELVR